MSEEHERLYRKQVPLIKDFVSGLHRVRRVMANLPCYMIFDDHDVTDEYMFKELPKDTYTVKVGLKKTIANIYVDGTKQVKELLDDFAE